MVKFDKLNLSPGTLRGLREAGYIDATAIQSLSLKDSLEGRDVLGAARTGSGKTLAFLIPLLESLHREKWCPIYGLGAVVISPTRELALQIFEVLKKIGKYHNFSAGAITGGKDLKYEWKRVDKCNILICTPGRLLHHMDTNSLFNSDSVRFVVLDEADRILEEGFAKQVNAIIANLPKERQTLLFSATQTRDVKQLARLSLNNPVFVHGDLDSVNEISSDGKVTSVSDGKVTSTDKVVMPKNLIQSYIILNLEEKVNFLWSFIQSHRKQRSIVFMSTCKQVKFMYELFRHLDMTLRRGRLLSLYGSLHQQQRMTVYESFCSSSPKTLLATDIASRGLDFPDVESVIQLDCPEDINTYIHRAGRTARYTKSGHSLLLLLPSEAPSFLKLLTDKGILVQEVMMNPSRRERIQRRAEGSLAAHVELKESAQRAFKAYLKHVYLMKDKKTFNINSLDKESYSRSLGLLLTPRIRFLEKKTGKNKKSSVKIVQENSDTEENEDPDDLFTVKSSWAPNQRDANGGDATGQSLERDDYEDGAKDESTELPSIEEIRNQKKSNKLITKVQSAKKILKKQIKANSRIVFDEDGGIRETEGSIPQKQTSEKVKLLHSRAESGIDIELAKEIMKDEDKIDKEFHRKQLRERNREKKRKLKEERMRENGKKRRAALLAKEGSDESGSEGTGNDVEGEGSDPEDVGTSRYIDDLPDPDKYYGNKNDNSDDEDDMYSGQFKGSRMRKLAPPSSDEDESDDIEDGGKEDDNQESEEDDNQESEEDDDQESEDDDQESEDDDQGDPEQLALHLLGRR